MGGNYFMSWLRRRSKRENLIQKKSLEPHICETCNYWDNGNNTDFGECESSETLSNIKSTDFFTKSKFGCIFYKEKTYKYLEEIEEEENNDDDFHPFDYPIIRLK